MASSKVGCSLKIYEAKANHLSLAAVVALAGSVVIQIRINLRYQLFVKAYGIEFLVDKIITPEFVTRVTVPLDFLLSGLSMMIVSYATSSPRIANFVVNMAKLRGIAVSDFITVAEISTNKIDYIREEEFDRISRTLNLEKVHSSIDNSLLVMQNVKSEDQSS
ncbi:hypothetical protein ES332_D08G004700v1 [Gossypium tomentosum]|uniref:Uncharacterized protein n=1 Tax=Gossypium tomentosum TaxID=34277 RepID=A0A5D2JNI3_GOSTO|nr:hypothetical protein ES332_D08G004700v1 [Gossypium tomentosum]